MTRLNILFFKNTVNLDVFVCKSVHSILSVATTNRIRRAEGEFPVAFTATISDHYIEHAGDHQVIVFDNVVTNVGNAYNSHVGIFVAPVNGIYVFSVTLFSPASVSFHANIVKNGQILTWLYLSGFEIKRYAYRKERCNNYLMLTLPIPDTIN